MAYRHRPRPTHERADKAPGSAPRYSSAQLLGCAQRMYTETRTVTATERRGPGADWKRSDAIYYGDVRHDRAI
jgi:hypothetical protein